MPFKEKIIRDVPTSDVKLELATTPADASSPPSTSVSTVKVAEPKADTKTTEKIVASPAITPVRAGDAQPQPPVATVDAPVPAADETEEKSRTARRFQELLDENRRLKEQAATPKPGAPAASAAPVVDENSPEYWFAQYNKATTLQDKQVAYAKWMDARDNALVKRIETEQQNKVQAQVLQKKVQGKFEAIHAEFPCLVKQPDNSCALDKNSPIVQRAIALANADEQPINSDATLLYYLQESRAAILSEQAKNATTRSHQLETKVEGAKIRTALQPPTVGSAHPVATADVELKSLEERSNKGDMDATRELLRRRL
jgi:hypothetical protein